MNITMGLEIYSICVTIGLIVLSLRLFSSPNKKPSQGGLLDRLLPLLIQYQTLRQIIDHNPQLPAQQVIPLLAILDTVVKEYQLEPIGAVWQQVEFNPQYHQADSPQIQPGELVYVRFIGYRSGSTIHVPAKVSRQLPRHVLRSN